MSAAESLIGQVQGIVRKVSRHRGLALGVAAAVAVLGMVGISFVQDRYEARARIYVDTQTVLKPLMMGLTFQPDIDEQVRMLARTLISRPNVERLIAIPELHLDGLGGSAREDVILRLMEKIKVEPTASGNLYEISYRDPTPDGARRLVEATVNLFVHSSAGSKMQDSLDAGRFIEQQIHDYEAKLIQAENRRKDFKQRTFSVSGISSQDYFTRVSTLSDEVNKLKMELLAVEKSRDSYRSELASEQPSLPAATETPVAGDPATELAARRKGLDELLLRFTEQHPDVINARRIIARMEAELEERRAEQQRAWAASGKTGVVLIAPTSPVYQKLRISLADAEAQIASLRSQLVIQEGRLDEVRALAGQAPQIEAELAQLNRDYDIIRKNYDVMVARRESATLGMKLDESSQLAEFRVIDPPRVSKYPSFPGRLHLALMAVVLSLVASAIAVIVLDNARPTLEDQGALQQLSKRPVLGIVPLQVTPSERQARARRALVYGSGALSLLLFQGIWVVWLLVRLHPEWSLP